MTQSYPESNAQNALSSEIPANDDSPIDGLSARHYRMLHTESGIADAVIRERGYRTCTGYSELKSLGVAARRDTDTRGLLLPLHTVNGQQAITIVRDELAPLTIYRPDTPERDDKGKDRKYLFPKGGVMHLDCPPQCRPAMGNPAVPLWVTEGQKKADALASHGACALALLGVWNWRGTNEEGGKVALADWESIALNGREVRLVFDSDIMYKASVKRALDRLTRFLQSKGARVAIASLSSDPSAKVGVDDYLLGHSLQDLERLLVGPGQPRNTQLPRDTQLVPLMLNAYQKPKTALWNVMAVLQGDERWQGAVKRNLLTGKIELHRVPDGFSRGPWTPRPIEDTDLTKIACWLQEVYELFASSALVLEAISAVATESPYHPVRDYLESLRWDGKSRLDTWLIDHCHVKDTPYTRAVGSKTLISAVARAIEPGCKVDTMLILQGPQGSLKSEAFRQLAGDTWFSDDMPRDLGHKDAKSYLSGSWLIEFAELSQFKRSEVEEIKGFVSTRQDTFRASYGRVEQSHPRQCIFVATTNQDIIFHDETGNRRFWPVTIHNVCDVGGIKRDRDQLWAEAMVRYRSGEQWWLTGDLVAAAEAEQEARVEQDPWTEDILRYLNTPDLRTTMYRNKSTVFVTTEELLERAIELDKAQRDVFAAKRVGRILKLARWRGGLLVANPSKAPGEPRQLRAFIPETLETLGVEGSVSGGSPHKTSSETLETLETLDLYRESESMAQERIGGELLQTSTPPYFQGKVEKTTHASVSLSQDGGTPTKSVISPETLEIGGSVSVSQGSVSAPGCLTDKEPCPHCGQLKMKLLKPGHLVCYKCGKNTFTTWQG